MRWSDQNPRPLTFLLGLVLAVTVGVAMFPDLARRGDPRMVTSALIAVALAALIALWDTRRTRSQMKRLEAVAEALENGDYSVRSGISGSDALARLSGIVDQMAEQVGQRVQRLQTNEERIRRIAYHDPLTELPNRRLFQELLLREVAQAKRADKVLGVVILDLDHFKDVNDSLGHTFGDLLLMRVAKRLQRILREDDLVARLGGDEFALLLPRATRPEDLLMVIRRLLSACRQPFQLDWREVLTSASIGVSFYPQDGQGPEALMRNADSALYQAKRKGRNNLQIFDPSMNQVVHLRLQLEQDLRKALKRDEMTLVYQPLVSLEDGRIVGLEALVRWEHPERGIVGPDSFIPLAEQTGLMPTLGSQVLELACRQIGSWRNRGLPVVPVSVNVSVRQLQTGDFVGLVRHILLEHDISPELIQFEITENVASEGARKILEHISALNRLGTRVAIDDFGTGYSSFSYLMEYQISTIKIDKSFLTGVPGSDRNLAIVKAIISLGKNLGLKVVAEGIETQEQLELLRQNECSVGQGYLLGKPQRPNDLEILLQAGHISLSNRQPVV